MNNKPHWSTPYRKHGFVLLSLFLIWHAVGISLVGPLKNTYLSQQLKGVYGGYLKLLHLDHGWPFYSPNPMYGSILKYQTISTTGEIKTYPLTETRGKYDHAYFHYTNFYYYLFVRPRYTIKRGYDKSVACYLCAQHPSTDISAIKFVLHRQQKFTYQDYQAGMRPLENKFLRKLEFGPYNCNQVQTQK